MNIQLQQIEIGYDETERKIIYHLVFDTIVNEKDFINFINKTKNNIPKTIDVELNE